MSDTELSIDATLQLEPDEMRRLGYQVIDVLVDHFSTLPQKPVTRKGSRQEMERIFAEPIPESPMDGGELLELV